MKIRFSHEIDVLALVAYICDRGWDDCLVSSSDSSLMYETASGSAKLTLNGNEGEYIGQRSLLFSHAVFAWVTRGWLDGDVEFTLTESGDSGRHPMKYIGRCFMTSLRSDVARKLLRVLPEDSVFEALETLWGELDASSCEDDTTALREKIAQVYTHLEDPANQRGEGWQEHVAFLTWKRANVSTGAGRFRPFEGLK